VERPLFAPKQSFAVPDLDDTYAPIPAVRLATMGWLKSTLKTVNCSKRN
jgi:hypothetical protein